MRDVTRGEVYSLFILLSCTKGVFVRVSGYRPCLVKAHGLGRQGGARWRKAVPAYGSVTCVGEEDLRQNITEQPYMMTSMFPGLQHPPVPAAVVPVHGLMCFIAVFSAGNSSPSPARGLWRSRSRWCAGSDNCRHPAVTPFAGGSGGVNLTRQRAVTGLQLTAALTRPVASPRSLGLRRSHPRQPLGGSRSPGFSQGLNRAR